jgi:hypothetical protein
MRRGSGRVLQGERKRGPVWYAYSREPSGRQHQKLVGPSWAGQGRPPGGYYTKRTAEDRPRYCPLEDAQRAVRAPAGATAGGTFVEAAEEFLSYAEEDRGCRRRPICGYRSQLNAQLLPVFGSMRIEDRRGWAPYSVNDQSS